MTDEKERDTERKLAGLFDRSAGALSESDRAKFLRRASDIGRVPRRMPPGAAYVWLPALAAAAAVVYLVVPKRHAEPAKAGPSAPSVSMAHEDAPVPSNAEQAEAPDPEDLVTAVLSGDPSELEPLDLGPLMDEAQRAQNAQADHASAGRASPPDRTERSMR